MDIICNACFVNFSFHKETDFKKIFVPTVIRTEVIRNYPSILDQISYTNQSEMLKILDYEHVTLSKKRHNEYSIIFNAITFTKIHTKFLFFMPDKLFSKMLFENIYK